MLDEENIKIIRTMKKHGPRNLQQVSRRSGVPYPTVYTRVNRLEEHGLLHTRAFPNFSKIGLARAMVLLTPTPGREILAREALKIPGYWVSIIRCAGEVNGYYSSHAVPAANRQEFEQYLEQLIPQGVATSCRVFWLGEKTSNIPNFDYFDPEKKTWKFNWSAWLKQLSEEKKRDRTEEKEVQKVSFDKSDLLILKELMKDARKKLSEFGKMLGVTLPAAKYRFDNIVKKGMVYDYVIYTLPYSPDVSDLLEIKLDFSGDTMMATREKTLRDLPFILAFSPVRGAYSISATVYLPRGELNNLLTLLSALVRRKVLDDFSYLVLDPMTIENQTFSYEFYEDKTGWHYDNREYLDALRKLVASFEKEEPKAVLFQPAGLAMAQVM